MPRGVYERTWTKTTGRKRKSCPIQNQTQIEKKIKVEPVEEKDNPIHYLSCNESEIEIAIRMFQTIVMNQQLVYPTTPLENRIIDSDVPTFQQIPCNWTTTVCIVVFPKNANGNGVTLYVLAFCRKTRQCLLMNEHSEKSERGGEMFKVDADELFCSKHVIIDMTTPKPVNISGVDSGIFPFQMPIQSLETCLCGVTLHAPSREVLVINF